jgi:hypothetical protein
MIAPNHLRKALLTEAVDEAANILHEPIDKVEVVGDYVIVRAGSRILKLKSTFGHGATLGSWSWGITEREVKSVSLFARLKHIFCAE